MSFVWMTSSILWKIVIEILCTISLIFTTNLPEITLMQFNMELKMRIKTYLKNKNIQCNIFLLISG